MSMPNIETINGVEICQTMGNNPDDPPEQHATGKPTVWWRMNTEWFSVELPIEEVRARCRNCGRSFQQFYMELWKLDRQRRANSEATLNSSAVKDSLTPAEQQ